MSPPHWIFVATCACIGALASGCSSAVQRPVEGRPVTVADFAKPKAPQPPNHLAAGALSDDADAQSPVAQVPAPTEPDLSDDTFSLDLVEREVLWVSRPGERVIVDSLVGEVNGRPIFADAFFEQIEDRLISVGEAYTGPQRNAQFRQIINSWLRDVVLESLLIAEAESTLTPQEKQGLLAFLKSIQEEEIRLGGGTRSGAERRRAEAGDDLDQYLGRQKDLLLIDQLRLQKIQPRVIVTWRDIEREYERRYDEFNPPATVTLARIRLRTESQSELIDQVNQRLAAGDAFGEIAEDLGFENGGVWQIFVIEKGGISDINVSPEMQQALRGLDEGDTSEPFTLGSVTIWLHVSKVNRPPSRSIYDPIVQRILKNTIRMRRSHEELNRYIESLLERGIYDELDGMAERLYQIALERYAP